jgi:hypothetical protein
LSRHYLRLWTENATSKLRERHLSGRYYTKQPIPVEKCPQAWRSRQFRCPTNRSTSTEIWRFLKTALTQELVAADVDGSTEIMIPTPLKPFYSETRSSSSKYLSSRVKRFQRETRWIKLLFGDLHKMGKREDQFESAWVKVSENTENTDYTNICIWNDESVQPRRSLISNMNRSSFGGCALREASIHTDFDVSNAYVQRSWSLFFKKLAK